MSDFMPQARRNHSIFRSLALLALAFGMAIAPLHLSAQTAEPAANSQTTAQPADLAQGAKSDAKPDSEEAQKNVFRLEGPLVKKTAKALNLSVETTANIFDYINFGIIVLLIGVPLAKVMPKLLRSRGEKVRVDLESARKATEEANARLSAIEAKLSGLDAEIAGIRSQVEEESKQDEVRIKSTIQEESARITAAAEQEINVSAAQARRSLRGFAADLAIEQAVRQLVLTPETDRALIAEFLSDPALTGKGGQK